jgi:hypothetical protein
MKRAMGMRKRITTTKMTKRTKGNESVSIRLFMPYYLKDVFYRISTI